MSKLSCRQPAGLVGFAFVAAATLAAAGSQGQQQPRGPKFSTATATVVVDVVVRDGQQRPVSGLTLRDFEIYEDEVLQTPNSFDAVDESTEVFADVPRSSTVHAETPADPKSLRTVVALVFEQLSPEGRRIAQRAAAQMVGRLTKSDHVGVFHLDRALRVIVPYTADRRALQDAVADAFVRPGYPLERAGAVPGVEYSTSNAGQASISTQDDSPYVHGHATVDALERLVDGLQRAPGRKAVILFSEGLALMQAQDKSVLGSALIPGAPGGEGESNISRHDNDSWLFDNRRDHLLRLFERANRAHVAFYTFDARGLRIESPLVNRNCPACAPYVGLQLLAAETGGAFVENTNDLVPSVKRVLADLHQHYLIGYSPTRGTLDGRYHQIRVKVLRRQVTVLARKGYRATPTLKAEPRLGPVRK
jgi:VWFA-related protein